MKNILLALLTGCGIGYGGLKMYQKISPNKSLDNQSASLIKTYVDEHNLKSSAKLTLMKSYMMYNKAFLDYGLIQKLQGFSFYQVYFNKEEADSENIKHIYCIFSPKDQVCGHPSIQHGGVSATILDQCTGVLAMLSKFQIVATAQLKMKYLQPIRKGQVYLLKGWIQKQQGRKVYVHSTIEDLQTKKKVVQGQTLMVTVNWQHKMGEVFKYLFHKQIQHQKQANKSSQV